MSDKQIAWCVKKNMRVTFMLDDVTFQGYVAGFDDYHWMVVTPEADVVLLHKGKVSVVYVREGTAVTLDSEPHCDEIGAIVAPFREWVLDVHFGQQPEEL